MSLLEVSQRPDRHKDLLDVAEAFGPRAMICFERGDLENIRRANDMALAIQPVPGGDIGWQIVDVGIMLTKHRSRLTPAAQAHLEELLRQSLPPWSDREFGRGNVNHPVIATWLYAAAGIALNAPEYSHIADDRLHRFIHIFSQVGDMSEYNSPTYLGVTMVGLANIGAYAELASTRLRARMIEERLWLSCMARWHPPSQQLAGPHSRAYADSTLGFGGIIRYLAHAVLDSPVFWDDALAVSYDHNHDAEWAAKIAASTFCFPEYLKFIGEKKTYPYHVQSITDGEDYTVDGREVYRGGRGRLTTFMSPHYCLGSSERPYVDGGQSEMCIAYWRRSQAVHSFTDLRAIYFRYVANERLPGQANAYYAWYNGRTMTYSPNLLHQDGRQHVLQHDSKVILLAQPVRRENGRLNSLRFDALLPIYVPLDEIWLGNDQVKEIPVRAYWTLPVLIRDGDIYVALRPLQPTDLGNAQPSLQIAEANHHLIISLYNLRDDVPHQFPTYRIEQTHNGIVLEIGSAAEYGDFTAFRRHISSTDLSEQLAMEEIRQVRYRSGADEMFMQYNPATQETLVSQVNGQPVSFPDFICPHAVQGSSGRLQIDDIVLDMKSGVPAWLAYEPTLEQATLALPTDQPVDLHLSMPAGIIECDAFAAGRIRVRLGKELEIEVESLFPRNSFHIIGIQQVKGATFNGEGMTILPGDKPDSWVLS